MSCGGQWRHVSSERNALTCTVVLWTVLVSIFMLVPVVKESPQEYVEISLRISPAAESSSLDSRVRADVVENVTNVPAEASFSEFSTAEVNSSGVQESVVTEMEKLPPSDTAFQKPSRADVEAASVVSSDASASSAAQAQGAAQQLVKSMEQLIEENVVVEKTPVTMSDADWDAMFADDNSVIVSSVAKEDAPNSIDSETFFSGTAAVSRGMDSGVSGSSEITPVGNSTSASSATASTLDKIGRLPFTGENIENGVQYSVVADIVADGSGVALDGTEMATVDGGTRLLIFPSEPMILISEVNERLIDGNREVFISFSISPSGQVNAGSIVITPASLLNPVIEEEIKLQISKWQFQPSSSSGQVSFKYNIMVR